MSREAVVAFIAAIIYLAILYALVRPGSSGPTLVNKIFGTFSDLVRGTLGYTWDATNNKWSAPQ